MSHYGKNFATASELALLGKPIKQPANNFDNNNHAVAIIAAYASKWVGLPATIALYMKVIVRARFPMIDGERSGMIMANIHMPERGPRGHVTG